MCGIIGYTGTKSAQNVIIAGLKRLEYRGYDSAGIAIVSGDPGANAVGTGSPDSGGAGGARPGGHSLLCVKTPGKVAKLESELAHRLEGLPGVRNANLAIGHTRWATHGEPNEQNAHPHLSPSGQFAIAHNGIIENYQALRARLIAKGHSFASETDSEVIAHLVEEAYEGDLQAAVLEALSYVEGTYGLVVVSPLHPGTIIAARNGSPIVVGIGQDESLIASDVSALLSHTNQVVYLDDGDVVTATPDSFEITSMKNLPVSRDATLIDWELDAIEKGGFEHFMIKEIHEQPDALTNAMRGRLDPGEATAKLSGMQLGPAELAQIDRITISACGTSMYAGMVGKYLFEDFASIPTDVVQAAEFRDRNPIMQRNSCMIAISQSGETADTLAAVREATRKGATIMGLCNVVGSTIAREAGRGVYLHAGPEISVASTKAFTCQVAVLAMMSVLLGRTRRLSAEAGSRIIDQLARLPELASAVIEQESEIARIARKYADIEHAFYIGRGYMYPAVLEGALKLKEISYVHAEGYHAAELKHGPIALLTPDIPVIVAVPESPGKVKTIGNMQECRARKAPVIAIATEGDADIPAHCDDLITIPPCEEYVAAIPVVIAEQLLAYHIARARSCEIDQPRNLAKSVTVE